MKSLDSIPSLTERVYRAILDEILDGRLKPGEHLVQEQLAIDLGVSRQPIQQAMALLKADGLVEEIGKRGLAVTRLDLTMMAHHYDIRGVLDGLSARLAAERVEAGALTAATVEATVAPILAEGSYAIESGSTRDQIHLDEDFHTAIYNLSGNPMMAQSADLNWRFLRRAMADVLRYAELPEAIWKQHRAIAEAIAAGDPDQAERLAIDHVTQAANLLAEAIRTHEAGARDGSAN